MKTQILFLSILALLSVACGGGSSGGSSEPIPKALIPVIDDVGDDNGGDDGTGETQPPIETYSVLKAWQSSPFGISMNFSSLAIGAVPALRLYYHWADGTIAPNNSGLPGLHSIRRCRDFIAIDGTESEGVIVVVSETGWTEDPGVDNLCATFSGTYHYNVDEQGLWFGPEGAQVLYTEVQ